MPPPQLQLRRTVAPFLALCASLLVTIAAAKSASRAANAQERLRFDNAANAVRTAILGRLDAYTAMLRGGAGLFATSEGITFSDFHLYVQRLELPLRYPGIQGIGFSRLVHPGERDAIAATIRRDVPSFHYWPAHGAGDIHAIVFLEPQDERNRVAMGYDMWSEPVRRAAMMQARDSAAPAATGRVRLVQEIDPEAEQAGFLIYVPVYEGGRIPQRAESRERLLFGFVYSPLRIDDLIHGILGHDENREVTFELYDGQPGPDRLMYRSSSSPPSGPFSTVLPLDVAGRPWTLVLHSIRSATETTAHLVVMMVGIGGTVLSILLFVVMRTQVRAREAAERIADDLRRSEEALREANRQKDEFLAIISHELRTPLNAIVGWAAMLRRGQVAPDGRAHALEVIERNAGAQAMLIEELLDISRAVAGRLRLDKSTVDAAAMLHASVDAVRPSAAARRITVAAELPDDLGTIYADPARLQQIVLNLLANGIKFTQPGGSVTLTAERRPASLIVRVTDTGIGIDPEFLPYVFERFRQADTSTTRTHAGVGLGLAIARHLVQLHGGAIYAESPGIGLGSTFTIEIPHSRP
jgi:signal transduction histidine kinase